MGSAAPIFAVRNLRKIFPRKGGPIEVLSGLNLDLLPAERVAILGKSGAGKSTFLQILGTLERPSSGKLLFLDQDILTFSEARLAQFRNREIGFVFQFHHLLLEFTAIENVMLPALIANIPWNAAQERAEFLLSKVGLSDRRHHKPNQLSGGEQQRVAIARALTMNPKILLTDEMTGNLDPYTAREVFELVLGIHQEIGMAMVSVTHDEVLAKRYHRILYLHQGVLQG